ncbi:MAG TPA: DUF4062 domain-containing protein [Planctomycetota bacterium]|nr:DUF4062 domain-containing protein [Planctomycetota bacterium]
MTEHETAHETAVEGKPQHGVVFVASTVHDLVDVRRELEVFLRELGLEPIVSDSEEAGLQHHDAESKLAACLQNIRHSDHVIVILSQRYGVAPPGHTVSYTHLEYRAAIAAKIPVHFFIRDRLLAAYVGWSPERSALPECPWVSDADSLRPLLEFIYEHDRGRGELVTSFRTIVDMKQRIRWRMRLPHTVAQFRRAQASGTLPVVQVAVNDRPIRPGGPMDFDVTNIGATPALFTKAGGVYARREQPDPNEEAPEEKPARERVTPAEREWAAWSSQSAALRPTDKATVRLDPTSIQKRFGDLLELCVAYQTVQGIPVRDVYRVSFVGSERPTLHFVRKELHDPKEG